MSIVDGVIFESQPRKIFLASLKNHGKHLKSMAYYVPLQESFHLQQSRRRVSYIMLGSEILVPIMNGFLKVTTEQDIFIIFKNHGKL